jgi:hypothetical protein
VAAGPRPPKLDLLSVDVVGYTGADDFSADHEVISDVTRTRKLETGNEPFRITGRQSESGCNRKQVPHTAQQPAIDRRYSTVGPLRGSCSSISRFPASLAYRSASR